MSKCCSFCRVYLTAWYERCSFVDNKIVCNDCYVSVEKLYDTYTE